MNKLFSIFVLVLIAIGFSFVSVRPVSADNEDCKAYLILEHYVNGQGPPTVYSAPDRGAIQQTIRFTDADRYILKYSVTHCPQNFGGADYKLVLIRGNNVYPLKTGVASTPNEANRTGTVELGDATEGDYTYSLQVSTANSTITQSDINVKFLRPGTKESSTGANANKNNNSGLPGSNSNSNSTVPGSKPDTGVDATIIDPDQEIGRFWNPLDFETVPELIATLIRILFMLTGLAAVIVIIIAGFRLVVDNGNETQVKKAKEAVTWAILGLIVSVLAFSIVAIVQRIIQS